MGSIATTILVTGILCFTGIKAYDMYICQEKGIKMYADPEYEKRIKNLEEYVGVIKKVFEEEKESK